MHVMVGIVLEMQFLHLYAGISLREPSLALQPSFGLELGRDASQGIHRVAESPENLACLQLPGADLCLEPSLPVVSLGLYFAQRTLQVEVALNGLVPLREVLHREVSCQFRASQFSD